MRVRRRTTEAGLISFLDVMCCGFGAVILLVVILNANVVRKRVEHTGDFRAELRRATAVENFAREELAKLNGDVATVELQQVEIVRQAEQFESRIREATGRAKDAEARARALRESIVSLQAQSAAIEHAVALLRGKATQQWDAGKRPIGFSGDGQRQYLTGLKLGGERTLVLLDSSASMLDETIVNVVRWKLMDPDTRRNAPKWQRAVRTMHWLVANLRPGKQFQIYQFGADAAPLIAGTDGKWLSTDDVAQMSAAIKAAREIAPTGGTSLYRAFAVIDRISPRPDSVILLTDGLPTQGRMVEPDRLISAEERLQLFTDAARTLPRGVPINTLLFPMEGDPAAAGAFWQLAIASQGSFITPSRDWP
ncbi:MAG TPA: VWA domain-containing protein [Alphaproteobacteria bacterium]|nr:VWA domain-containing protein [Alphaproteobacteria bacterium]